MNKNFLFSYRAIPGFLREFHGERARLIDLVIVYLTGAVAAVVILIKIEPSSLTLWKVVLTTILALDIGGGVAAVVAGSAGCFLVQLDLNVLRLFVILFIIKLTLGFAVRRPEFFSS